MQNKESKARQKLIDDLEKEKSKRIKREQKRFTQLILTYLYQNLQIENNILRQVQANYNAIAELDNFKAGFERRYMYPLLKWLGKSIVDIVKINEAYFGNIPDSISARTNRNIRNRAGITKNGVIKKGGFLSSVGKTDKAIDLVKSTVLRGITNRVDRKSFDTEIKRFINPPEKEGILEKEFLTKTQDFFSIIDRETSNNIAVDLGLNFAIYQGGVIGTSREFCKERNNKVFSKTEIQSWANLDFQGKSDPYDPFTDCGGYNCRHQLDWISDELAYELRPDLKNE